MKDFLECVAHAASHSTSPEMIEKLLGHRAEFLPTVINDPVSFAFGRGETAINDPGGSFQPERVVEALKIPVGQELDVVSDDPAMRKTVKYEEGMQFSLFPSSFCIDNLGPNENDRGQNYRDCGPSTRRSMQHQTSEAVSKAFYDEKKGWIAMEGDKGAVHMAGMTPEQRQHYNELDTKKLFDPSWSVALNRRIDASRYCISYHQLKDFDTYRNRVAATRVPDCPELIAMTNMAPTYKDFHDEWEELFPAVRALFVELRWFLSTIDPGQSSSGRRFKDRQSMKIASDNRFLRRAVRDRHGYVTKSAHLCAPASIANATY